MTFQVRVVVATVAFDELGAKDNVRFVFFATIPHSLDYYFQEANVVGGNGLNARALMFYAASDLSVVMKLLFDSFRRIPTHRQWHEAWVELSNVANFANNFIDCRRRLQQVEYTTDEDDEVSVKCKVDGPLCDNCKQQVHNTSTSHL